MDIPGDDLPEMKNLIGLEIRDQDLDQLKYLGMEVARSKEGIIVSQRKYVLDLLKETNMSGCCPVETQTDPNIKFGNKEGNSVD
uniref:Reverse transcriptase Ty1/copia-type domain-containing protein n=1 Tax=Solanum lycopersicum TaxID=4081 RepID=A0A3Q7GUE3_SOLLC